MRGQASLFDGITFLLLATAASAMVFVQVGNYGVEESKVLRSAFVLNYMQSVVKAMYSLDSSTLQYVTSEGLGAYKDLDSGASKCADLVNYAGNVGVADLIKRDLTEAIPRLDDSFDGSPILGKTAARCAMKELMKPFAFAGFDYIFEVLDQDTADASNPAGRPVPYESTGSPKLVSNQFLRKGGREIFLDCDAVSRGVSDSQAVSAPFQVVYTSNANGFDQDTRRYRLRFCIWPGD